MFSGKLLVELQFLVSMFPASYSKFERARSFLPASYCGVALCMILCSGKVLGGSHVGLVVATGYCETHMEGLAAFQGIPLWKVWSRFDFQGQQRALNFLNLACAAQFDKAAATFGPLRKLLAYACLRCSWVDAQPCCKAIQV